MALLAGGSRLSWVLAIGLGACGPSVSSEDTGQGADGSGDESKDPQSGDGDTSDDTSPAPLCSAESCEGDPTGEWAVVGACVADLSGASPNTNDCEPEECAVEILDAQGDYSFATSARLSLDVTYEVRCRMPKSCYEGGQCDDDGDDDNGVCVDDGDVCACSQSWDANIASQGIVVIQAGGLELHDGDQFWSTRDWCVDGDTLEIEAQTSWGVPGYRNILTLRTSLERVE